MADKDKKKRRPSVAGKRVSVSHEAAPAPRAGALDLPEIDASSASTQKAEGSVRAEPAAQASAAPSRPRVGAQAGFAHRGRPFAAPRPPAAASDDGDAAIPAGQQEGSRITHGDASSKTGTPRMEHGSKKRRPSSRRTGKRGISRRFVIVSSIVVLLLAVGCGLLAWNQWLRFDDAADIQGTWTVEGTEETITFTDTDIVMTDEVSYPYTLDTFHKTIDFSFKQYSGSGSYAFSPERTTLVITEEDADTQESVSTKLVKR